MASSDTGAVVPLATDPGKAEKAAVGSFEIKSVVPGTGEPTARLRVETRVNPRKREGLTACAYAGAPSALWICVGDQRGGVGQHGG